MRRTLAVAILAVLGAPAVGKEKPPVFVEATPVKDKPGPVALAPGKAYILLRGENPVPLYLMKVATADDQASYDRLRAAAFAEARTKYMKKLANWERDKKAAGTNIRVGDKPLEPTEANFEFTSFGMMTGVQIGPMNRFAKSKTLSTYLHELTPGTYRIYGQLTALPGVAPTGGCFCMGSVKFEARAGEIVDLGTLSTPEAMDRVPGDSSQPWVSTAPLFRAVKESEADPRLSAARIVPARYKPVGKLPNYFGVTMGRIPPMPGVLRYDRDRIVDLTTD